MKQIKKKILGDFDNTYGGDILFKDDMGQKRFIHFSYEEVCKLFKKLKKKDRFIFIPQKHDFLVKKITKDQKIVNGAILDVEEVLTLFLQATRPKDVSLRKEKHNMSISYKHNSETTRLAKIPTKVKRAKMHSRFDWHDHYLEGLRIHGNIDDAEAHADEMKRKYLLSIR